MLTRLSSALVVVLLLLPCLTSAQTWIGAETIPLDNYFVGLEQCHPKATITDAAGNVYVTGEFQGSITLGSITLTSGSPNTVEAFAAKLDPTGTWQWAVGTQGQPGGIIRGCQGQAITLDAAGNVFVVGTFGGRVAIGPTILISSQSPEGNSFVAKISPSGDWQWVASITTSMNNSMALAAAATVAVEPQGNILVAGKFARTATFGTLTATTTPSALGFHAAEAFVASLNPAGDWQWVVTSRGSSGIPGIGVPTTTVESLLIDPAGNAIIQGGFSKAIQFGSLALRRTDTTATSSDVFVASLSPTGIWRWANATDSPGGYSVGSELALAPTGQLVLTGTYRGPTTMGATTLVNRTPGYETGFLAALTPASGTWQWAARINAGTTMSSGQCVVADAAGRVVVGGNMGVWLTPFLAMYSATGTELWQLPIGLATQANTFRWQRLDMRGPEEVRLTGTLQGTAFFGPLTVRSTDSLSLAFAHLNTHPVGTPDEIGAAPFHLAPNPAHHAALLTGAAPRTRLTVVDVLGRTVLTATTDATGTAPLDVRALPAGLYLVRAYGRAGARRLVVE